MCVRLLLFSVAIAVWAGCPACSVQAQDANSAKLFVDSLYALYGKNAAGGVPSEGARARRYYHSSLLALMRADEKAARPGVGAIDADPICECQDWDGIWDLHVEVKMQSPDRAIATVSFALVEAKDRNSDSLYHLTMTLVPENGQWRIWDIRDESDPKEIFDVRNALEDEIRQLAKPPKTPSKR